MAAGNYLIQVRMTGFEPACRGELHEVLGFIDEAAGSDEIEATLDAVEQGTRPVVHRTNCALDADNIAGMLTRAGAQIAVQPTHSNRVDAR